MFESIAFESFTFYFGIALLSLIVIYFSWKSTFVSNQHNLTLLIWPAIRYPIGSRTVLGSDETTADNENTMNPTIQTDDGSDDENTVDLVDMEEMDDINLYPDSDINITESSDNNSSPMEVNDVDGTSDQVDSVIDRELNTNISSSSCQSESVDENKSPVTDNLPVEPIKTSQITSENNLASGSSSSSDQSGDSSKSSTEESIRIRLKFLDDKQKMVLSSPAQNVLSFKKNHFSIELSEHRVVRLIFNGKLLKQDESTLSSYGLFDNCVLHCHVSQPKPPPPPPVNSTPNTNQQEADITLRRRVVEFFLGGDARGTNNNGGNDTRTNNNTSRNIFDSITEGLDLSNFIVALLWVTVMLLWFIRFNHSYMFSTFSTFMLIFLTMLLVVPHYLFAVDVQLNVDLNNSTMRNLGIERIFVLAQTPNFRGNNNATNTSAPNLNTHPGDATTNNAESTDHSHTNSGDNLEPNEEDLPNDESASETNSEDIQTDNVNSGLENNIRNRITTSSN